MENQKEMSYYTPTIEELHIGYQCEITYAKDLIGTRDEYFFKYVVEPQYFNEGDYVAVRTPFLTKEQIEAEGWKPNLITDELIVIENNYCFFFNNTKTRGKTI